MPTEAPAKSTSWKPSYPTIEEIEMYPYDVTLQVWAISREREEEARLTRPHTEKDSKSEDPR